MYVHLYNDEDGDNGIFLFINAFKDFHESWSCAIKSLCTHIIS